MYKVYFENRFDERIFLDEAKNEEEIYGIIKNDIAVRAQPSFKWYYTRVRTTEDGEKIYDIGSHVEYYIAVPS